MSDSFFWDGEIPDEIQADLGQIDPRMASFFSSYTEGVERDLEQMKDHHKVILDKTLGALAATIMGDLNCSELEALELLKNLMPLLDILAEINTVGSYIDHINEGQIGLGDESNYRAASVYLNAANSKLTRYLARLSLLGFESSHGLSPNEYLTAYEKVTDTLINKSSKDSE